MRWASLPPSAPWSNGLMRHLTSGHNDYQHSHRRGPAAEPSPLPQSGRWQWRVPWSPARCPSGPSAPPASTLSVSMWSIRTLPPEASHLEPEATAWMPLDSIGKQLACHIHMLMSHVQPPLKHQGSTRHTKTCTRVYQSKFWLAGCASRQMKDWALPASCLL